ncbi:extracellular matrix-binding protein ebh [Hemibagrus wyckioides]|uniref:extracellular matrix-binding protein ebh n=1 Tax=Hemibagrus wyckioides TaxID=337641 RepID=UPI00266DCC5A|nr:extracellular matrix-binding protein ebh [Hemibagrus wyckioides]
MWLSMFSLWGSLLTLVASQSCPDPSEHNASWVRLKPLGQCKDGESTCPYRITLPPLTVQLPKPFRELEKMARELQRLTQMVNQLKEDCRVCKEKQGMDWNIRTDDEGKDREKIQASRGTLNTKGRQQDIAKRESTDQVTTLRSAVEDIVVISNDEKEVNPTVLGKQRNTNQERNVNPLTTKPKAETSGGPKGSDSSQKNLISRKTFEEVPSVTTTKKKILQSPLDTLSESSFIGGLDNEQRPQHEKASTIKIGHERNPSGTLTAKGKVKSIPEYHVDSVVTVDDDDDDDDDSEDGDVETKQMQTTKDDKVKERQHVTGTDAQNNRGLEPNMKRLTRKQQEKEDKKEVADPGIKESRSYIFEGTNNGNVAKEGHVSVTQQPSLKNKEQNENNNHTAGSTKPKPLKPGTYSGRADTIRGQKKLSSPITGKASASVNVSQINSQTLEIKSKHGFKPDTNTGLESDGGMHSNPIYNVDTASGVKNSRSPTSGRTNTTAHVELIKPKIQKSNSQTPFKPGTNTESNTGVTLRNSRLPISGITDGIADVSPTNPQILDNNNQFKVGTDSESDAGIDSNTVNITKTVTGQKNSRQSILDKANTTADANLQGPKRQSSNSRTSLKPNKNAEYNPEMDSNPVNKIKTVSGKEMLRSPISGTDEGTVNVSPTNPQILDSGKQLRTHTDSESDAVMDLNPVNNNDTVNGLKNSRSPISGRINATADLNLLNPRKPTSNSQTSLKSSKDKEHHIGMNLNPDNKLKNSRSPISGLTDGTVDVSPTNPQIVHSKNQVKVGRDSGSDARVGSNPVNNTETVSGQEISRSDGIGDVGPTNQQILNSKNRFKTGTDSENDAVSDVATLSASNNSGSPNSDITDAIEVNQTYPGTLDGTFKKQLQPGTDKERKPKIDSNPIIGRADARVRVNQINTQKVNSNSKNTTVASTPVNKVETVSLLETPRSPISGRFHPTTDQINPRAMDHISENPLKPSTVSERKVYPYRNHTSDTVNQQETSESRISDSRLDVNDTNPHLNSNNNLPKRQLLPKSKLNMTRPRNGRVKSPHPMSIDNERQQTLRNNKTTFLKKDGITSGRPLPTGLLPRTLEKQKEIINQPERTNHTGISLSKDPTCKKPYILHILPVNKSFGSRETENSSGVYNYTMNNGTTQVYSKTVSIMPTLATHGIVDQAHIKRVKNVTPVKVLDTVNRHIESTSQTAVTKLKKPDGHSQQDLVLHTVNNTGRASQQPVVEEPKGIGRRTEQTPFKTSRVDSNQEKHKKPLRVGGTQIPAGKMPLAVASSERNELNYPTTTAHSYTIKTEFKDKQSKMSQFTPPITTTPHFMDQDHAEQAKTTSRVKVSNKHVHHRHKNPSQEMESKKSHSDTGNKELQSGSNGQGSSEVTDLQPNISDSIQSRAVGSTGIIMDFKVSAGSKVSTTSTDSTNENKGRDSDSVVGNNGGHSVDTNNGNSYPFTINRMTGGTLHKILDGHTNNGHNKKPLTNMNERQGLEKQLLSTCHGDCDPSPTPWSEGNSHKSSNNDRDKPVQDCSDIIMRNSASGIYNVTPSRSGNRTFPVFCDMKSSGGGWTLIQHRFEGSISFNRTWNDYKRGFGKLTGEFWLGNDKIHWLTSTKAMVLRIELEDLDGVKEYAQYDQFHVGNESQYYRLMIEGYSGTAGDAMQYNRKFNHNQKNFTTPDRDNDQYPSGNCGAYYSSGWWFDACMAANLNGKYYETRYKGIRNGIFWGTWHNISIESYLTNDRQSFKTVRMMIRPRTGLLMD